MPELQRRPFRRSIALRLALGITVIVAFSTVTLALFIIDGQSRRLLEQIEGFGQLLNQQLAANATEPLFTDQHLLLEALVERMVEQPSILGAALYDHHGQLLVRAGAYPRRGALPPGEDFLRLEPDQLQGSALTESVLAHSHVITYKDVVGGHSVLLFSERALHTTRRQVFYSTLLMAAALILAIVPLALYLGRRLARPIHSLVDATRLLQQGRFTEIAERRNDELGQLIEQVNNMAAGLVRKAEVEELMHQVLDRDVAQTLLQQMEPVRLGGDKVVATVLFADMVGFTSLSEQLSPEATSEFLNEYFHYFNICSRYYFGTVDKFIGDAVMIVFGAPRPDADHQTHAVACALLMQRLVGQLNQRRRQRQQPTVELRIGINSGDMVAGLVGSRQRLEYTVVGDAVNLASRLCSEARAGEVIIAEPLYRELSSRHAMQVSGARQIHLRGKRQPIQVYSIDELAQASSIMLDQLIDDVLQNHAPAPL